MQAKVCSLAEVLYRHFLEEPEKTIKDFCLDSWRPGRDWNRALPEPDLEYYGYTNLLKR
jgi:hypothetical protein